VIAEQLLRPAFCLRAGIRHDADSVFIPDAIAA
jgi:dihydroorotase